MSKLETLRDVERKRADLERVLAAPMIFKARPNTIYNGFGEIHVWPFGVDNSGEVMSILVEPLAAAVQEMLPALLERAREIAYRNVKAAEGEALAEARALIAERSPSATERVEAGGSP